MDPITLLATINGALTLAEAALPLIDDAVQKGLITKEQQAETMAKYNALKARADGQFAGAAWQVT